MTSVFTPTASRQTTSTETPLRVLVIVGSIREGRFGPVPAHWFARHAADRPDLEVHVVDLAENPLPMVLSDGDGNLPPVVTDVGRELAAADAVVVVTPVYNRGYPASLKNAIDWFHDEWAATPVGFVSYGGRTGGVEAVEQLRTVFVELHTMTIRNVLSFPDFWEHFTDAGRPVDPRHTAAAADGFLDQLTWWARALREARRADAVRHADAARRAASDQVKTATS